MSEFAGAAHSFATAIHVNPWSIKGLARMIWASLKLPQDELVRRNEAAYKFASTHTARQWGLNFLDDLEQAERYTSNGFPSTDQLQLIDVMNAYRKRVSRFPVSPSPALSRKSSSRESEVSDKPPHVSTPPLSSMTSIPDTSPSQSLSVTPTKLPYRKEFPLERKKRAWKLFVLDYDGCLIPFQAIPQLAIPPLSLLTLLKRLLSASPDNVLLIVSGRDRVCLEEWFGS